MSVADAYFTEFFKKKSYLIRHCDTFQKSEYSSKNGKVIIEVKDTTTKLYYCLLLVVQPQKKATTM